MAENQELLLYPIKPGEKISSDWFQGSIPPNIQVGENSVIDSSFSFKHFFSKLPVALRIGSHVTLWRTSFSTEENGLIEIGNYCYLAGTALVASEKISIGDRVFIAGGVTIVDSDFHPIDPAARLADTIAISPLGDHNNRPAVKAKPVTIGDDVWIGYNATILKGVKVGAGAVISPGAVVIENVAAGITVAGNPAKPIQPSNE
jgi:acetyltransferase-like isoleucine patch superfamily enzyme